MRPPTETTMRKMRSCHRHLREVRPAARAGSSPVGRELPATPGFQGRPTTSALAWKALVRGAQLLAAVALSQLGYRLACLPIQVPGSVIVAGLLLSLASSRFLPVRCFEKGAALVIRYCQGS